MCSHQNSQNNRATDLAGWRLAIVLASLSLGLLLVAVDNTILAVAIPEITTIFYSLQDVGWYGSAYLLAITALQPTFGKVYKLTSVKVNYLVCVVIFEGKCSRAISVRSKV